MPRQLPSLNALRAFEAAGRHLSLTRAAGELHVTPAAVGHQVKALEDYLGQALFKRLNRGLELTPVGRTLLPGLEEGLDRLAAAVESCRRRDDERRVLTLSVAPSFAARWLVPRLELFREQHPDIDVRLDPTARLVNFEREDVDLGVRYGLGQYKGVRVERLLSDELFPVCSPRLLAGPHPLKGPEDLRHHPLLHFDWQRQGWPGWEAWVRQAGLEGVVDPRRGPRFTVSALMLQAAVEGQGVALGSRVLVADDLAAGRLVRPFPASLQIDAAYYLIGPRGNLDSPKVAAFRRWLHQEARRSHPGG